ncbi:CBS domain-containing protein [Alteromonas pelagimontana]|uniref:CBS domain-containing protein n=1 Tax=Alteromonas pelagimontana TaxID=1858656 RepID=A0A6M4MGD4_9ALTE|nr:CBS domain-containing protein [Alteromonas pelagimontana]QJR81665.1 CBS domain-containing protein [Alteromonas pelagimontana]
MQIREVMSENTEVASSKASVRDVAQMMAKQGAGLMPVYDGDKLIGAVTDRDLVTKALANGVSTDDEISKIVNDPVLYCFRDDDTNTVLNNMKENHVQRLIVLDNENDKRLVGIVSVGDIADKCQDEATAKSIVECCKHYH